MVRTRGGAGRWRTSRTSQKGEGASESQTVDCTPERASSYKGATGRAVKMVETKRKSAVKSWTDMVKNEEMKGGG